MQTSHAAKDIVERDLLRRSIKGDMNAFKKLYAITCRQVYTYLCRMLTVRSLADAALIETYNEAARSIASYKTSLKVSTWILSIARSIAMQKLSHPDIRKSIEKQILSNETKISLDSQDRQRLLFRAIHTLPMQQREILSLILLPNENYEEMAKFFKCTTANAKLSVFHAKAEFKKNLMTVSVKR